MLKLGIDPEKPYRTTFISQHGLCCCNMALVSFRLFCKNLGHLRKFFGQMAYRPPLAKNFPYAYVQKVLSSKQVAFHRCSTETSLLNWKDHVRSEAWEYSMKQCIMGYMKFPPSIQAVLDTVHVTNFVQSRHCRWRTDSFTFVRIVSSIFFDFRRLSSDLRLYFLEKFE